MRKYCNGSKLKCSSSAQLCASKVMFAHRDCVSDWVCVCERYLDLRFNACLPLWGCSARAQATETEMRRALYFPTHTAGCASCVYVCGVVCGAVCGAVCGVVWCGGAVWYGCVHDLLHFASAISCRVHVTPHFACAV